MVPNQGGSPKPAGSFMRRETAPVRMAGRSDGGWGPPPATLKKVGISWDLPSMIV
jgi:hypothetical protein